MAMPRRLPNGMARRYPKSGHFVCEQDLSADCPVGWTKENGLCTVGPGTELPDASCEDDE